MARGAPRSVARALGARSRRSLAALAVGLAALAPASPARAIGALYAGAHDAAPTSDAAQIVVMRDGNRTVLTIQSVYRGPPEDFVMIVPVPSALSADDVRTLPPGVFEHLDALSAPRLVEYWEEDPCPSRSAWDDDDKRTPPSPASASASGSEAAHGAVASTARVEAQFTVGEYDVAILAADEPAALERLLRAYKVELPEGGQTALRPYQQPGAKLLVARVAIDKVKLDGDKATLSPLRLEYDEPTLTVPLRIGAPNAKAVEDVVVYVLAPHHQRYEAATYANLALPTNVEVSPKVKASFAAFSAALFDKTVGSTPRAVVTEYAWPAQSCDPCPSPSLSDAELTLLGADVIPTTQEVAEPGETTPPPPPSPPPGVAGLALLRDAGPPPLTPTRDALVSIPAGLPRDFLLTRLHLRFAKGDAGDDLALRKAPPIEGGREFSGGHTPVTLTADAPSSFQARYVARHAWAGAVDCDDPHWGVWGGQERDALPQVTPARGVLGAPRDPGAPLASLVSGDVPSIGLKGTLAPPAHPWRRSTLSRLKDPWVAFAIGLTFGALGLAVIVTRRRDRGGP